jgi:hypothetical protein
MPPDRGNDDAVPVAVDVDMGGRSTKAGASTSHVFC